MKRSKLRFSDALSSRLLAVQCSLISKKYGPLAVLLVRSISIKELTDDRLRLIQPALVFLAGWVKVSEFFGKKAESIRSVLSVAFDRSLLYELIFFLVQGVILFTIVYFGSRWIEFRQVEVILLLVVSCLYVGVFFYRYRKSFLKCVYLALTQTFWVLLFLVITGFYLS